MDLFDRHRLDVTDKEAPLAARMRPRTLDEFIGQGAIVGPGRLLRRAIQADQLASLIFYGPPGTGKTTLARVIANTTKAHFISLNAVLAGVKDIREAIALAQEKRGMYNQRTILFVDEVHRFNKAQQDALLPWVENGTVILIGATTENPYFEVNKALVSRSRLFQLKPLAPTDLKRVVQQALTDPVRGYGDRAIHLDQDALEHLVNVANGDARALLNALELAVETTPPNESGAIHIDLAVVEESIQQRAVLYDKEGDAHFDTISAFIKSVRGSDPDAALYWLARMVYAGEDPRFIFRRLLILAGEDVGLADPQAVVVVNACAQAFDRVGMPEGRYPLAQATLYLATCPKSNSVMGFFDALATVEQEREAEVPTPLRDSNRDKQGFGHGAGYLYPHAYRDHWVAQQYLPSSLQGQVFYQPSDQGYEAEIRHHVARQREAQLAALVEGIGIALPEVLTFGTVDVAQARWLERTLSQVGDRLSNVRDRVFELLKPQRHHVLLDVTAGSGLLTWEAVRRVPEGGVYALAHNQQDAVALTEQAIALPELSRPIILQGKPTELTTLLKTHQAVEHFDGIVGRNLLLREADKLAIIRSLISCLQPTGTLVLAESIIRETQRIYQLFKPKTLPAKLQQKVTEIESAIYTKPDDPSLNWDVADLQQELAQQGLNVTITVEQAQTETRLSAQLVDRYLKQLQPHLTQREVSQVQTALYLLVEQPILWRSAIAYIVAHPAKT
ncbi:MAG TPA: AAA family ATPase [Leptolyngbyaceae cyanobacterium M33_DOE_097]|uniref:Replication-associated recombination protein A n=1 Tax=Oscillatoriales cyanobacterium SpSt-418 TaxID=2282169 RepID=A0A7C3KC80_9CYAN|nr:AAA family ATPase [Leptolyngbyaceae cyanobacterium M33_DOE_097]